MVGSEGMALKKPPVASLCGESPRSDVLHPVLVSWPAVLKRVRWEEAGERVRGRGVDGYLRRQGTMPVGRGYIHEHV